MINLELGFGFKLKVFRICPEQKFAESYNHDFQICKHNYFIADARHRSKGVTPFIPNYQVVIMDEAHKFLSAARQMCGNTVVADGVCKMTSYFWNEQIASGIWEGIVLTEDILPSLIIVKLPFAVPDVEI